MPGRNKFPDEYFEDNPLDGESPQKAYKRLQWGNDPNRVFRIEAPEAMAMLGELANLIFETGRGQHYDEGEYYVAVGVRSNRYYLVPIGDKGRPDNFPPDFLENCKPVARIRQIDYYSDKGGEPGYYYHKHEKPYPMLYGYTDHFVCEPAAIKKGRSYAVSDEGIIG